jgi:hypothetical protein
VEFTQRLTTRALPVSTAVLAKPGSSRSGAPSSTDPEPSAQRQYVHFTTTQSASQNGLTLLVAFAEERALLAQHLARQVLHLLALVGRRCNNAYAKSVLTTDSKQDVSSVSVESDEEDDVVVAVVVVDVASDEADLLDAEDEAAVDDVDGEVVVVVVTVEEAPPLHPVSPWPCGVHRLTLS